MTSNPDPPAGLQPLLRSSTAAAHQRLEDALGLLQQPLQQSRFVHVLAGFHGFHQAWEPALQAALDDAAFCLPRRRVPLLQADLLTLGMPLPAVQQLPRCNDAAALCADTDAALGSLYVMEGSTLGGRVIDKQLSQAPWCPQGGLRYFNAHGADTGRRWRETVALIEARAVQPQRVVAAAVQTFDLLQRWVAAQPLPTTTHRLPDFAT